MRTVFGDTSFYVAALSPRDTNHSQAQAVGQGFRGRVFTTEYVLLEVATFFCGTANRVVFLNLLRSLQIDPEVSIVPASAHLWRRGIDLFAARLNKDWSLPDCISFVVMQEQGIHQALTADHHFEQAGFTALLK